ncbi:MAG TPA: hypothetical protein VF406_10410 [Thermodesulfobacteriota bacterium]
MHAPTCNAGVRSSVLPPRPDETLAQAVLRLGDAEEIRITQQPANCRYFTRRLASIEEPVTISTCWYTTATKNRPVGYLVNFGLRRADGRRPEVRAEIDGLVRRLEEVLSNDYALTVERYEHR